MIYQLLIISSLYIVLKLLDYAIDSIHKARVKRDLCSDPILRYEYYKTGYSTRLIKKLRRMKYSDYLKTKHWERARSAILKRDHSQCADCGALTSKEPLEVHHVTYIRRGRENLEDMMTLCSECHQERHFVSTVFE